MSPQAIRQSTAAKPARLKAPVVSAGQTQTSDFAQEEVRSQSDLVQRIMANPSDLSPEAVLGLQSRIGNHSTARLLGRTSALPASTLPALAQATTVPNSPPTIQRVNAAGAEGGTLDKGMESSLRSAQSGGSPLPGTIRKTLEPKLGADLSSVKIHTDNRAVQLTRDLNAKAFTHKNHIFYGAGQSPSDLKLTTHETVHTIQQGAVRRMPLQRKQNSNRKENGAPQISEQADLGVQRLIDRQGLIALAGAPHEDKSFLGFKVKKMSTAYKSVLTALDRYQSFLMGLPTTEPGGMGFNRDAVPRINAKLDTLRDELQVYVDGHEDDTVRTPHIQAIINTGIPQERQTVAQIAQNSGPYLMKTFADAIKLVERVSSITTQVQDMYRTQATRQKRESDELDQKEAKQEDRAPKPSVAGLTGGALKGRMMEALDEEMGKAMTARGEVTSYDFRGNTVASKLGAAVGEELTRPYIAGVVMPSLTEAIGTRDEQVEIDPVRLEHIPEGERQTTLARNVARLKRIYANFMRTFSVGGAAQVPLPYAQFIAETYNASAQKMSEEHAYLMVSSQIFLRTVNPVLGFAVASAPEGQGKRALTLLAKLVQSDANNVTHGAKEDFLKVMSGISYSAQIEEFVRAVIARGSDGG
jgi:hypothetical protein